MHRHDRIGTEHSSRNDDGNEKYCRCEIVFLEKLQLRTLDKYGRENLDDEVDNDDSNDQINEEKQDKKDIVEGCIHLSPHFDNWIIRLNYLPSTTQCQEQQISSVGRSGIFPFARSLIDLLLHLVVRWTTDLEVRHSKINHRDTKHV